MLGTFESDTAWPEGVMLQFRCIDSRGTVESQYYGPYNVLLNYITGYDLKYQVAPQASIVQTGRDSVDFVMWYVVKDLSNRVLMFLEVKGAGWIENPSTRAKADAQMRQRFSDLGVEESLNPRVYGVCALGRRISTYVLDTASGQVAPAERRRASNRVTFPADFIAEFWDRDILSQGGFDEMKRIMADIRLMSP